MSTAVAVLAKAAETYCGEILAVIDPTNHAWSNEIAQGPGRHRGPRDARTSWSPGAPPRARLWAAPARSCPGSMVLGSLSGQLTASQRSACRAPGIRGAAQAVSTALSTATRRPPATEGGTCGPRLRTSIRRAIGQRAATTPCAAVGPPAFEREAAGNRARTQCTTSTPPWRDTFATRFLASRPTTRDSGNQSIARRCRRRGDRHPAEDDPRPPPDPRRARGQQVGEITGRLDEDVRCPGRRGSGP
jgi:hypothetical protein